MDASSSVLGGLLDMKPLWAFIAVMVFGLFITGATKMPFDWFYYFVLLFAALAAAGSVCEFKNE